jgi:hypothetical protein
MSQEEKEQIMLEYYEGLLDTKYIGLGHAKKLCFGLAH